MRLALDRTPWIHAGYLKLLHPDAWRSLLPVPVVPTKPSTGRPSLLLPLFPGMCRLAQGADPRAFRAAEACYGKLGMLRGTAARSSARQTMYACRYICTYVCTRYGCSVPTRTQTPRRRSSVGHVATNCAPPPSVHLSYVDINPTRTGSLDPHRRA